MASASAHLNPSRFLDLTHLLTNTSPSWTPGEHSVRITELHTVGRDGYSIHQLDLSKAGTGTHFDSGGHIVAGKRRVHQYGPADLIAPLCVINVTASTERDADYRLTPQDVHNYQRVHGPIPPASLVLLNSGWTRRWPDATAVLNVDTANVRHFPGYSVDAAVMLVELGVVGVAVDTMSIDYGPSAGFEVHHVVLGADKYGVENVKVVDGLPEMGATAVVCPLLYEDGSESPCRMFAHV